MSDAEQYGHFLADLFANNDLEREHFQGLFMRAVKRHPWLIRAMAESIGPDAPDLDEAQMSRVIALLTATDWDTPFAGWWDQWHRPTPLPPVSLGAFVVRERANRAHPTIPPSLHLNPELPTTIEVNPWRQDTQATERRAAVWAGWHREPLVPEKRAEQVTDNPMELVSAARFASMTSATEQGVLASENRGELFSLPRDSAESGRQYPVFQAWPGVAGAPIQQVLRSLDGLDRSDVFAFFAGVTDLLLGLTPVEVLMGRPVASRPIGTMAQALLDCSLHARLTSVLKAAEGMQALRAA